MESKTIELMKRLEGLEFKAYDCTAGKRTVGLGFNMDALGARSIWQRLNIPESFNRIYNQQEKIEESTAIILFEDFWARCKKKASIRCAELDLDYESMPEYKKFILADIVYNTGSISNWTKVITNTEPRDVLYEARRNPKPIMDSRVAKIGNYFGIISSVEEANQMGLVYAKYIT